MSELCIIVTEPPQVPVTQHVALQQPHHSVLPKRKQRAVTSLLWRTWKEERRA